MIAFSLIATTVGSYSFVKYSRVAYEHGLSSSQTYLNDWFWIPLLIAAASIAVAYALFVGGVVYRRLTWADLYDMCVRTTRITGVIFLIIYAPMQVALFSEQFIKHTCYKLLAALGVVRLESMKPEPSVLVIVLACRPVALAEDGNR